MECSQLNLLTKYNYLNNNELQELSTMLLNLDANKKYNLHDFSIAGCSFSKKSLENLYNKGFLNRERGYYSINNAFIENLLKRLITKEEVERIESKQLLEKSKKSLKMNFIFIFIFILLFLFSAITDILIFAIISLICSFIDIILIICHIINIIKLKNIE